MNFVSSRTFSDAIPDFCKFFEDSIAKTKVFFETMPSLV